MSNKNGFVYRMLLSEQRFYEDRIGLLDRLLAHAEDNGLREEGHNYFQERLKDYNARLDEIREKIRASRR